MAKVIGKDELCRIDDIKKYFIAVQGIEGKTLFDRYKLAETNIINKYIDANYRDFLAYPVQDGNTITFHGKKPNENEVPQHLSDLQGSELEKYQNIKTETLAHYHTVIGELDSSGKTVEAEFLSKAIKYIDDQFVYCYDEIVVLGVWGMQLRDHVREDTGTFVVDCFENRLVSFDAGENGMLNGKSKISKKLNAILSTDDIPQVTPNEGYEFAEWNMEPDGYKVTQNTKFVAQYRRIHIEPPVINDGAIIDRLPPPPPPLPPPPLPWWKRFWLRFTGKGCLKWLLWLLLLLLLLLLFWWLFRSCSVRHTASIPYPISHKPWIGSDPRVGHGGGIYDPGNPYTSTPTPPEYAGILPPEQGVLPPLGGNPEIIPGNPSVIGNRLNILMENDNKSIMDLAKDFKTKYPDDKYKVVYYDNVVKRMQIEIPSTEREQLKQQIPSQFAPDYELFTFDEALFEGNYKPNDPAFSDNDKSWYLNAINATQAWDITRGSPKLTVAIVDNGFNLSHPELKSKVVTPYDVWKHSTDIFPQQIDHGTHVAGIALAIMDNGKGLCGIAPECKFMPVQVADAQDRMTTTSVLDGILYALYQGADVVNVSLGSQFTGLNQYSEQEQRDLIQNHFKEEERLWREITRIAASHNSTIVVAAGNDNVLAGIDAIQRPELVVTVSAVDKNNRSLHKADFSNYGEYSTISAPGVGIYSCIGKNDYAVLDGTSMAAPIVSGAIALMKSLNDSLTTKQIICILQNTGLETQGNIGKLIQLDKALEKVKSGEQVDCTPAPSTGDVQVLLKWNNYNDLDLICTDPYGETVFFRNRRVSSGGQLQIDMNVEYPDSKTPVENIFWQPGSAPNGTYNVYLLYYRRHEPQIDETPYNIKVKYGGKTEDYSGEIKQADKVIHICTFTLGSAGNVQNPNQVPIISNQSQLEHKRDSLQQELDRVNDELRRLGNNR